jgi:hypothetical protein
MGLLPRGATFAEEVTDFFLAFRGAGVALSPLDVDLLLDWQARGVPYAVVCRGIRRAAEKRARDLPAGEPALRSLRSCARAVDEEFRRHQGLAAGRATGAQTPEPRSSDRLGRARGVLARATREGAPPVQQAATRVLARLPELGSVEDLAARFERVAYLDDAFALGYLRALPFAERLPLLKAARDPLRGALGSMSLRARRAALRAHRVLQARSHGALPALK